MVSCFRFDGVWDPERWHRGDTGSRGPSPLTLGDIRERRIERDGLRRASGMYFYAAVKKPYRGSYKICPL